MSAVVAKNASVGGGEIKERMESSPKADIMTANANPAQKSHIYRYGQRTAVLMSDLFQRYGHQVHISPTFI
jgi:hypothetical protein